MSATPVGEQVVLLAAKRGGHVVEHAQQLLHALGAALLDAGQAVEAERAVPDGLAGAVGR